MRQDADCDVEHAERIFCPPFVPAVRDAQFVSVAYSGRNLYFFGEFFGDKSASAAAGADASEKFSYAAA